MFEAWSQKCSTCANYAGSRPSAGFCRVWGTLLTTGSAPVRQCPHWTSREAWRLQTVAVATLP